MTPEPIEKVFGLFTRWGECNYIGEKVTQLQHAQQVRSYGGLHKNEQIIPIPSFGKSAAGVKHRYKTTTPLNFQFILKRCGWVVCIKTNFI